MRAAAVLLFLGLAPLAAASDWGPWGDRWAPVGSTEAATSPPPARSGRLEALYQAYRRRSARDGARCPFYPTCSGYFILAARSHGPLVASLLLFDRLSREHQRLHEAGHYPIVTPHETPRLYDPVPPRRRSRTRRAER